MTTDSATNPVSDSATLSDTGVAADAGGEKITLEGEVLDDGEEVGDFADPDAPAAQDPAEEVDEIERNGTKYKVPKALTPELMMQADYTRKTQELAEARRTLEATAAQQAQVSRETLQLRGLGVQIDAQLAEIAKLDLNTLTAEHRAEVRDKRDQLREAKVEITTAISDHEANEALEAQRSHATRLQEAHVTLAKDIPGWGPEVQAKVGQFGLAQGFTADELNNQAATQAAKVDRIALGQKTQPAPALRGPAGKFQVAADTSDFAAFEKLADAKLKTRG
jgi:hypothetical protein